TSPRSQACVATHPQMSGVKRLRVEQSATGARARRTKCRAVSSFSNLRKAEPLEAKTWLLLRAPLQAGSERKGVSVATPDLEMGESPPRSCRARTQTDRASLRRRWPPQHWQSSHPVSTQCTHPGEPRGRQSWAHLAARWPRKVQTAHAEAATLAPPHHARKGLATTAPHEAPK